MFENLTADGIKKSFKENNNVRLATYVIGGILVIALGYLLYWIFVGKPAEMKSREAGYVGLNYAAMDSTDRAIDELAPFVKKYDGKTGGEVGQFVLARQYMTKGNFKKALELLEDVKVKDTYVRIMAVGLQGDCHSELKQYDEAVKKYKTAAQMEENEYTSPMYLFKAALLTENKLKNPSDAAEMYQEIKDKYVTFSNQKTIDRYIERAKNKKVK